MANISRVCDKQQSIFSNKNISIYNKLQKKIENGSRCKKKRKSRKSNRVCRKNKENIRKSKSSIKEDKRI